MKKILFLCLVAVFLLPLSGFAQSSGNAVVDLMLSGYSYKAFNDKPVSDKDIDLILKCGIKAPSARNLQPWRFTVVKNPDVMKKIVPDAKPGNALIIVSGVEKRGQGTNIDLDCGPRDAEHVPSRPRPWAWVRTCTRAPSRTSMPVRGISRAFPRAMPRSFSSRSATSRRRTRSARPRQERAPRNS